VLSKLAAPNAPVGYLLVFLNLWLDAFTNASQDRVCFLLRRRAAKLHSCACTRPATADALASPVCRSKSGTRRLRRSS
jgi:hypothetical protein